MTKYLKHTPGPKKEAPPHPPPPVSLMYADYFLQQVPIANGTNNPCGSAKCDVKLELAFEYLMSKDRLRWVTITSQQVSARHLRNLAHGTNCT